MTRKPDDWMPLHIGKYLADTTHLTRDQHGAYLLLLMAYWRRGGPLPAEDGRLAAIAKATSAEWRKLKPALTEFFTIEDGCWVQKRAETELSKAKALTEKKAEAGASGARSKWGASQDGGSNRSARLSAARKLATHTALEWHTLVEIFDGNCVRCGQSGPIVKDHIVPIYKGGSDGISNLQPLCRSCNSSKGPEDIDHRGNALHDWQERLAKCLANAKQVPAPLPEPKPEQLSLRDSIGGSQAKPPKAVRARRGIPDDFPGEPDREWAQRLWLAKGRADLCEGMADQVAQFRDHHAQHGKRMADWPAAWRTWARNALDFTRAPRASHAPEKPEWKPLKVVGE